jgi:hypothetical protein
MTSGVQFYYVTFGSTKISANSSCSEELSGVKGDTVSKYRGSAQLVSAAVIAAFCSFLSILLKNEIQLWLIG